MTRQISPATQELQPRSGRRLLLAFGLFWIPVGVFVWIAGEVVEREHIRRDVAILDWIHGWATPGLDQFFIWVTRLGNVEVIIPLALIILSIFLYRQKRFHMTFVAASLGGAAVANLLLKVLFHRDRPDLWQSLIVETGYSFPSGHAMVSSALIASLVCIAWNTRGRWWAVLGGGLLIGLIGVSRLYFGVHYPTDIIAGWCVSLIWVAVVYVALRGVSSRLHRRTPDRS